MKQIILISCSDHYEHRLRLYANAAREMGFEPMECVDMGVNDAAEERFVRQLQRFVGMIFAKIVGIVSEIKANTDVFAIGTGDGIEDESSTVAFRFVRQQTVVFQRDLYGIRFFCCKIRKCR